MRQQRNMRRHLSTEQQFRQVLRKWNCVDAAQKAPAKRLLRQTDGRVSESRSMYKPSKLTVVFARQPEIDNWS